jgi:hypothetical protein
MARSQAKHGRRRPRSPWRRRLGLAVAAVTAAGGVGFAATAVSSASPHETTTTTTTTIAITASTIQVPNPFTAPAIARFLASRTNVVSAAVCDLTTGTMAVYHPGLLQPTASMVKLDILIELLAHAQASHRSLTDPERTFATTMITQSDNDAATALFNGLGGPDALNAFNASIGLRSTTTQWNWGATMTTPADQVALLRLIVLPNQVLNAESRATAMALLEGVEPGQRFGIAQGPPEGATVGVKNGWFPEVGTGWQINSAGFVLLGNTWYLASIETGHNPSKAYGLDTVSTFGHLLWRYERFGANHGR